MRINWLLNFDGGRGNGDREAAGPTELWTASHQMTINGRRDGFTREDFRQCARSASMKRGRADSIIEEVRRAVARWQESAQIAGVSESWQQQIQQTLRL